MFFCNQRVLLGFSMLTAVVEWLFAWDPRGEFAVEDDALGAAGCLDAGRGHSRGVQTVS